MTLVTAVLKKQLGCQPLQGCQQHKKKEETRNSRNGKNSRDAIATVEKPADLLAILHCINGCLLFAFHAAHKFVTFFLI
jgi:hypothetical protein